MEDGNGELKPPAPLPKAQPQQVSSGVTLLPPLTHRGKGPGLITLIPDTQDSLAIKDGVPSTLMKWAEEGYTVVEIQESAFKDGKKLLTQVVDELAKFDECEPKDAIGLIVYDSSIWDRVTKLLPSIPSIVSAIVYADASKASSLSKASIPTIQHLAGTPTSKPEKTKDFIVYDYPLATSSSFAVPFQPKFHYSSEGVAHTRNLQFLKPRMNGPYFDLETLWDEHTYYEFANRSVEHTMSTMVEEPYVNHIPTMTGGTGRGPLSIFYRDHFIFSNPPDSELELISRTVGIDRVVDEFIYKFTHISEVPWLVPGLPPTGKRVEVPFTAVVNIRGDRLYHEHIAWDQASVLIQLGLMPEYLLYPYALPDGRTPAPGKKFEYKVPAAGIETSVKMRDKNVIPSNELMKYSVREVQS